MALKKKTTAQLAKAKLVALDVDGTLTQGRVSYVGDEELVSFCVRDGQGLVWLRKAGVQLAWITGRGCRATERRAAELGVTELFLRAGPKAQVLEEIQERLGISVEETVAMGDDLPDLGLARRAAVFYAPKDAHPLVRKHATSVTDAPGGVGAVRELCEDLLRAQGLWDDIAQGHLKPAP